MQNELRTLSFPTYTLALFGLKPEGSAPVEPFETVGPFDTYPSAFDTAETLARDTLQNRAPERSALVCIEVRARHSDGTTGAVDALERDGGVFLWRAGSRLPVRDETPRERVEMTRGAAEDFLRREYRADVRSYAEDILRAVSDGEIEDSDALETRLHETCDGSERIIYTSKALDVLRWTEHDDAALEEMGSDALASVDTSSEVYTRLAYFALRADISEALERFDASDLGEFRARTLADFDPRDDDTFPVKRGEDAESTADEIREGIAKSLHGLAWADCAERYGLSNLSGCEILDVCSDTSEEARTAAERIYADIERAERKRAGSAYSLAADFLARIEPAATSNRRSTAEDFGHCIALESLGHGAGWADDNPEHGLDIPHAEFLAEFDADAFGLSEEDFRARAADAIARDPELSDGGQDDAEGKFTLPGCA